ncbi:GNAT family protein [Ureibacillus composti]|nr:GNAT family protein [Ureibacillus composti]
MKNITREFPVLETERLVLRRITEADAGSVLSYLSDEDVMKYYGLTPFQTIDDALAEVDWYDKIFSEETGIRWGITIKGQDEVIGSCGFHRMVSQHHRSEIGFELSKTYWGQGFASEAVSTILSYGFEHLHLNRIEALIEPANLSSQKLVIKHGFLKEGLLRSYEYTRGKFDDLFMYSLLKRDFEVL